MELDKREKPFFNSFHHFNLINVSVYYMHYFNNRFRDTFHFKSIRIFCNNRFQKKYWNFPKKIQVSFQTLYKVGPLKSCFITVPFKRSSIFNLFGLNENFNISSVETIGFHIYRHTKQYVFSGNYYSYKNVQLEEQLKNVTKNLFKASIHNLLVVIISAALKCISVHLLP